MASYILFSNRLLIVDLLNNFVFLAKFYRIIVYIICNNPDISTYKLSEKFNIRQMTCWKFKKKIIECINQRGDIDIFEKEALTKEFIE